MKKNHDRTEAAPSPTGDEAGQNLLRSRARALAKVAGLPPVHAGFDVIVFTLANERYGLETQYVREVCPPMVVTPIPCTPSFVAGVMNVRGDILAVIDLKAYFEIPVSGHDGVGEVIIAGVDESIFGILTDSVIGLSFVALSDFQGTGPRLAGRREKTLKGISAGRVAVLDISAMLAEKKLWVHEEVAT